MVILKRGWHSEGKYQEKVFNLDRIWTQNSQTCGNCTLFLVSSELVDVDGIVCLLKLAPK